MEPQHCILCWSCVVADRQSSNCRPNRATAVKSSNNLLPIMLVDSRPIRRASQRKDTALTVGSVMSGSVFVERARSEFPYTHYAHFGLVSLVSVSGRNWY